MSHTARSSYGESLKTDIGPVDDGDVVHQSEDAAQQALHAAYEEYRNAMSGWRAGAKSGSAETSERLAGRLLQARVGLYRALVTSGWVPPHDVGVQLDRDAALMDAPQDFDALLAVS